MGCMAENGRNHDRVLRERLLRSRVAFVTGPRQVGKTTSCRALAARYLDWAQPADRLVILKGPDAVAKHLDLERTR